MLISESGVRVGLVIIITNWYRIVLEKEMIIVFIDQVFFSFFCARCMPGEQSGCQSLIFERWGTLFIL